MQKTFKIISVILLLALASFLCLYNLDKNPIQQWDEQTNISVVNETLKAPVLAPQLRGIRGEDNSSGRIVGGLIYQNQPFFEKPPVWYFATIGIASFCKGATLFDKLTTSSCAPTYYRLISSISGIGVTFIVYFIVKKQWGHWAGVVSGLSLLSIGHLFINNVSGYFSTHTFRSADLDALQILFIMLGILFYILSRDRFETCPYLIKKKTCTKLVFLFSALAVMTKGPIGLLPIVILLSNHPNIKFLFISSRTTLRDLSLFKRIWQIIKTQHLLPFSIFLLITIPWHIWMYAKFGGEFIDKYFFYHMVERATATIEEHKEQLWFYLQMFLEEKVFIIGVPVIAGIVVALKNKVWKTDITAKTAILGILIPLIFFTLVPTKLAWYNLYIYPFAAIMVGYLFKEKFENKYLNIAKNVLIIGLITIGIIQNIIWIVNL